MIHPLLKYGTVLLIFFSALHLAAQKHYRQPRVKVAPRETVLTVSVSAAEPPVHVQNDSLLSIQKRGIAEANRNKPSFTGNGTIFKRSVIPSQIAREEMVTLKKGNKVVQFKENVSKKNKPNRREKQNRCNDELISSRISLASFILIAAVGLIFLILALASAVPVSLVGTFVGIGFTLLGVGELGILISAWLMHSGCC